MQYWKEKFELSQQLICEAQEKSLQLEEIPGFLTIKKVKPKTSQVSTRVTQVFGSMEGKDVIKIDGGIIQGRQSIEKKSKTRPNRKKKRRKNRHFTGARKDAHTFKRNVRLLVKRNVLFVTIFSTQSAVSLRVKKMVKDRR